MGALGQWAQWVVVPPVRRLRRASLVFALAAAACGGSVATGKHRDVEPGDDGGANAADGGEFSADVIQQTAVSKLDLLLMIDNSLGMADKQAVLAQSIPALVKRLTDTNEFNPALDIHIGVITSSLGGHGAALCSGTSDSVDDEEQNDHGWLLPNRPRFTSPNDGAALEPGGFLDWNPSNTTVTPTLFDTTFQAMVDTAGEFGCGLESQLESIYRFLSDPNPYKTVTLLNCPQTTEKCAVPIGLDTNLLNQRAAFLRPDSAVAVVMLTDENDCSIQESGDYVNAARLEVVIPHGSTACASNPNDACCYFCGDSPPAGCAADPTCTVPTPLSLDQPNLRCFHQKQRFGKDFLYPTARYVNAFTSAQLCTSRADLASDPAGCMDLDGDKRPDLFDNPLFAGGAPNGKRRDPSLVFVEGIVGVPWQDIKTDVNPDRVQYPAAELHFATASELVANGTWNVILGNDNPGANMPPIEPTDSLMVESKDPRGGSDGENPPMPLEATTAGYLANPVNGHEWANPADDDLQYACIFELATPRDCPPITADDQPSCDCRANGTDMAKNPLCQKVDGSYSTTQRFAKAFPGLRELQVLKDLGPSAVVASICPRNMIDATLQDYGYQPAFDALVDRVKNAFTAKCLPQSLTEVKDPESGEMKVDCHVIEVRPDEPGCSAPGRSAASRELIASATTRLEASGTCGGPGQRSCDTFTFCELAQGGQDCHSTRVPSETAWCYIDPDANPADDPALVANCGASDRRLIRFIDPMNATPAADATMLLVCPK